MDVEDRDFYCSPCWDKNDHKGYLKAANPDSIASVAYVNPDNFDEHFSKLQEELQGGWTNSADPLTTIDQYLRRALALPRDREHHVTVIVATAGGIKNRAPHWYQKMRARIREAAARRVYIRVSVLGVDGCDGGVVNDLSGLTFDKELRLVEYVSTKAVGPGATGGQAPAQVAAALERLTTDFRDVAIYVPYAITIDCPDGHHVLRVTAKALREQPYGGYEYGGFEEGGAVDGTMQSLVGKARALIPEQLVSHLKAHPQRFADICSLSSIGTNMTYGPDSGGITWTWNGAAPASSKAPKVMGVLNSLGLHHTLFAQTLHLWCSLANDDVDAKMDRLMTANTPDKIEYIFENYDPGPYALFGSALTSASDRATKSIEIWEKQQAQEQGMRKAVEQGIGATNYATMMLDALGNGSTFGWTNAPQSQHTLLDSRTQAETEANGGKEGYMYIVDNMMLHAENEMQQAKLWAESNLTGPEGAQLLMLLFKVRSATEYGEECDQKIRDGLLAQKKAWSMLGQQDQAFGAVDPEREKDGFFAIFDDQDADQKADNDWRGSVSGEICEHSGASVSQPQQWLKRNSKTGSNHDVVHAVHPVIQEQLRQQEADKEHKAFMARTEAHRSEFRESMPRRSSGEFQGFQLDPSTELQVSSSSDRPVSGNYDVLDGFGADEPDNGSGNGSSQGSSGQSKVSKGRRSSVLDRLGDAFQDGPEFTVGGSLESAFSASPTPRISGIIHRPDKESGRRSSKKNKTKRLSLSGTTQTVLQSVTAYTSDHASVKAGDKIKIVAEYPDHTVLIRTPNGNLLLDMIAFQAPSVDDLDDLDLETFSH